MQQSFETEIVSLSIRLKFYSEIHLNRNAKKYMFCFPIQRYS